MSNQAAIQGTPIQIALRFPSSDSMELTDHPLDVTAGPDALLAALVLGQLPQGAQDQLATLFATPPDALLNQFWTQSQDTVRNFVADAIESNQPGAYHIVVTLPPQGSLTASVDALSPGMAAMLPPGTEGSQLTLSFSLPGVSVSFGAPATHIISQLFAVFAGDPAYQVTFDLEIEIDVAVPQSAVVPMAVQSLFLTHNTQASATDASGTLNGLLDIIVNWLAGKPAKGLQDQAAPLPIPQLNEQFSRLSSGFAAAAAFGFVGLGVKINTNPPPNTPPGNTIEFDLIHPLDLAPIVTAWLPQGLIFPPQIGTSAVQVHAGDQLGVTGISFPAEQFDRLTITWGDTTSGRVVNSDVQWGVSPVQWSSAAIHATISRDGSLDHHNEFTAENLQPNTPYDFRVRDRDAGGQVATPWSDVLTLTTSAPDQLQLVLNDTNNNPVGSSSTLATTVALQNDGTFSTSVTVPTDVPPGHYLLSAVLSGQSVAVTPITVVAADQLLAAVLQVFEPTTDMVIVDPRVFAGDAVNVRGLNFGQGAVNFFLDSNDPTQSLGQWLTVDGSFKYTFPWPGATGPHVILAQVNTLQATAAIAGDRFE